MCGNLNHQWIGYYHGSVLKSHAQRTARWPKDPPPLSPVHHLHPYPVLDKVFTEPLLRFSTENKIQLGTTTSVRVHPRHFSALLDSPATHNSRSVCVVVKLFQLPVVLNPPFANYYVLRWAEHLPRDFCSEARGLLIGYLPLPFTLNLDCFRTIEHCNLIISVRWLARL